MRTSGDTYFVDEETRLSMTLEFRRLSSTKKTLVQLKHTTPIFSNREILYSSYTTLTCKYKYQLRSQYSVYNGVSGVGGPHGHGRNVTVGERKRDIGI